MSIALNNFYRNSWTFPQFGRLVWTQIHNFRKRLRGFVSFLRSEVGFLFYPEKKSSVLLKKDKQNKEFSFLFAEKTFPKLSLFTTASFGFWQ